MQRANKNLISEMSLNALVNFYDIEDFKTLSRSKIKLF